MKRVIVFCSPFLSLNPLVIIFFYYQQTYQRTKIYRQKIHRLSISVGDFVGKLITNGMLVQIPTKNSVGKSKDCGNDDDLWHFI
jgi:hypothetical protein